MEVYKDNVFVYNASMNQDTTLIIVFRHVIWAVRMIIRDF